MRQGGDTGNIKGEPYAAEAKELLRSKLIGKQVSVNMEYSRTIPTSESTPDLPDRTMNFGSVHLMDKKNPGEPGANVAEMVVVRGLASVVRHRGEDDRSMHYDALLEAESRAQKQKKGMHSSKEPPVQHLNDVSFGPSNKAKQFLPFLQRSGTVTALVEMVMNGHRLKLLVPKESAMIVFALSGVRTPSKGRDGGADEPYAAEALAFTRLQCMQMEVEIDVEAVDNTGTFLGNLRTVNKRVNLATSLLEAGLGSLHPMYDVNRNANGPELAAAENAAKQARLKIWENFVEPVASSTGDAEQAAETEDGNVEAFEATAMMVVDGSTLYVHRADKKARLDWLVGQLEGLGLKEAPATGGLYKPSVGALCCSRFTEDNQWYRARVTALSPDCSQVTVFYVDFGNSETLSAARLTTLDPSVSLQACPPLAVKCQLAYLKVPSLNEDFGMEAATALSEMVFGCTLAVRLEGREAAAGKWGGGDTMLVTLIDADASASVNARLVEAGLARVKKVRGKRAAVVAEGMKEFQERARQQRLCMWQYGDVDSDED
ncbi:hypothetical protein CYMTET_32042 [Cymbomonas tetramitiformis]|uniref:Uncharacterized protein n=1 Tax=Cymbomonas tetramitiformis TaxID=36881 RepID=A0AAE0FFL8_9CHLO|nr:hypothetical protein CYMTET_32042 [Cymbomonas tetramitiformis]